MEVATCLVLGSRTGYFRITTVGTGFNTVGIVLSRCTYLFRIRMDTGFNAVLFMLACRRAGVAQFRLAAFNAVRKVLCGFAFAFCRCAGTGLNAVLLMIRGCAVLGIVCAGA